MSYGYNTTYAYHLDHNKFESMPSGIFFDGSQFQDDLSLTSQYEKGVNPIHLPWAANNHDTKSAINCFHIANARYTQLSNQNTENFQCLPVLNVDVNVHIRTTTAKATVSQTFTNISTLVIKDAKYSFPLPDGAAVTEFRCHIGDDRVLTGVVKRKDDAKAEFKEAVAQRKVAALLEEHTPEIFETHLGNIPAKTRVKIKIAYVLEVKADLGGEGILLTIPTSIAPRYGNPPSALGHSTATSGNGLQITVNVMNVNPLRRLECRTHPMTVDMNVEAPSEAVESFDDLASPAKPSTYHATATLSQNTVSLGRDFTLLILAGGGSMLDTCAVLELPTGLDDQSAMMLSLNPRTLFSVCADPENFEGELIFVADRSGSMLGPRINTLKEALQIFLRSIPSQKVRMNVYSFGSSYSALWPSSAPYGQEALEHASAHVASFQADMGGTEILSTLRDVVAHRSTLSGSSTQIILLTDGEVWREDDITNFVRDTKVRLGDQIRFFALGIGDQVSHRLVEGIGKQGGGFTEVVGISSNERWQTRVIRLLKAAMMPPSFDCYLEIDGVSTSTMCTDAIGQAFMQAPYRIPALHPFSRFPVFWLMDDAVAGTIENIVVKVKTSSAEPIAITVPIQRVAGHEKTVHALAAKAQISTLESGQSWLHNTLEGCNESVIRSIIESLAIRYHLTSKWTSFIAVENHKDKAVRSELYRAAHDEHTFLAKPQTAPIPLMPAESALKLGSVDGSLPYSRKSAFAGRSSIILRGSSSPDSVGSASPWVSQGRSRSPSPPISLPRVGDSWSKADDREVIDPATCSATKQAFLDLACEHEEDMDAEEHASEDTPSEKADQLLRTMHEKLGTSGQAREARSTLEVAGARYKTMRSLRAVSTEVETDFEDLENSASTGAAKDSSRESAPGNARHYGRDEAETQNSPVLQATSYPGDEWKSAVISPAEIMKRRLMRASIQKSASGAEQRPQFEQNEKARSVGEDGDRVLQSSLWRGRSTDHAPSTVTYGSSSRLDDPNDTWASPLPPLPPGPRSSARSSGLNSDIAPSMSFASNMSFHAEGDTASSYTQWAEISDQPHISSGSWFNGPSQHFVDHHNRPLLASGVYSSYQPISTPTPPPRREAEGLDINDLISTQQALGFFKPSQPQKDKLSTHVGLEDVEHDISVLLSEHNATNTDSLLATDAETQARLTNTVVIVLFIQKQYAEDKELWELVIGKAERWVAQLLSGDKDLVAAVWEAARKAWK